MWAIAYLNHYVLTSLIEYFGSDFRNYINDVFQDVNYLI